MLAQHAEIHHHQQPCRAGAGGGGVIDDADLHPDGARADGDRLVDDRSHLIGAAEDVDDLDRGRHRRQVGMARQSLPARQPGVDRQDLVPDARR